MDDVRGKVEYAEELKKQGILEEEILQKLAEYDAMDMEQQAMARSALAQLHIQGTVPVPDRDFQDAALNAQNASSLQEGSYDPELSDKTSPEDQASSRREASKISDLRSSILGPPKVVKA